MAAKDQPKVRSLRDLPSSIEPPRDLWPQIEARLQAERPVQPVVAAAARRVGVTMRWLAAAAMVASVAVGVWIGRGTLPVSAPGPAGVPPSAAVAPATAATQATSVDAAYVSDPRYQRARAQLVQSLQARLNAMPPPARAKVAASLATIEKAKQDLEQALGKDPSNALLQELLINTYQDEMRALTDVHETGDTGRGI